MDRKMKNKLTKILEFLVNIENDCKVDHIPKLRISIQQMKDIADHEDDCFMGLPDNMMFGNKGRRYLQNSSDLNVASRFLNGVIENLESYKNNKKISNNVTKAKKLVKGSIDR